MKTLLKISTVVSAITFLIFVQLAIFTPHGWDTTKLVIEAYIFAVIALFSGLWASE